MEKAAAADALGLAASVPTVARADIVIKGADHQERFSAGTLMLPRQ